MFLSSYENSIDAKKRAIIPSKFRHELGEKCILTKGVDKCLYIFTQAAFEQYAQEHILNRPDEDENARKLKLAFFSNVKDCEIDKQGRIKIPDEFLDYAGVKKEMVNVGVLNHIQVWAKEIHDKKVNDPKMNQSDLMADMTKYLGKGSLD
jgi:MraZ protein